MGWYRENRYYACAVAPSGARQARKYKVMADRRAALAPAAPPELFSPADQRRADTLAIKQAMADVMSAEDGLLYWTAFVGFIQGRIDKTEFELEVARSLTTEELKSLHNALILSVLYNTTRSEPPPVTARAITGWNKRKRRPDGSKVEDQDPKRRKLKNAALALGKRERERIKGLIVARKSGWLASPAYLKTERPSQVLDTPLGSKVKITSSTLYQDYIRCSQAPLCADVRELPEVDMLKDRMTMLAYDCGLSGGVDKTAAHLARVAVELHLKCILADLLSLVRTDRSTTTTANALSGAAVASGEVSSTDTSMAAAQAITIAQASVAGSPSKPSVELDAADNLVPAAASTPSPNKCIFAPAMDKNPSSQGTVRPGPVASAPTPALRLRDAKTQGLAPHLTTKDFSALLDISPHALVSAHPGAVERLIATGSFSEPASSEDEVSDCEDADDEAEEGQTGLRPPKVNINGGDSSGSELGTKIVLDGMLGKGRLPRALSSLNCGSPGSNTSRVTNRVFGGGTGAYVPMGAPKMNGFSGGSKNVHQLKVQMPPPANCSNASAAGPAALPANAGGIAQLARNGASMIQPNGSTNGSVLYSARPISPSKLSKETSHKDLAAELFPEDEPDPPPASAKKSGTGAASSPRGDAAHSGTESEDGGPAKSAVSIGRDKVKKKQGWDRVDTFRLLENVGQ